MSRTSSFRRAGLAALGLTLAVGITGCIGKRRPRPEDAGADPKVGDTKTTPEPAAPTPAAAPTPTEAAPAAPPAGEPEHKYGEASRIPNYAVPAGSGPSKGPDDALVTLVEFNAFGCAECKKLPPVLDKILDKWGDDVRLVFRHAPTADKTSQELARAAAAAHAIGKFWEVHDELMGTADLGLRDVMKRIGEVGGDASRFGTALQGPGSAALVKEDLAVIDTFRGDAPPPIVFVNGRYLDGAITFEQVDALVAEEKQKAEAFLAQTKVPRDARLYDEMRKRGGADGTPWRGYSQIARVEGGTR